MFIEQEQKRHIFFFFLGTVCGQCASWRFVAQTMTQPTTLLCEAILQPAVRATKRVVRHVPHSLPKFVDFPIVLNHPHHAVAVVDKLRLETNAGLICPSTLRTLSRTSGPRLTKGHRESIQIFLCPRQILLCFASEHRCASDAVCPSLAQISFEAWLSSLLGTSWMSVFLFLFLAA